MVLKINLKNVKKQEIAEIAAFFKKGKVIVYPTDTIYGLGCLATDKKAIEKIYKIKKRDGKKPFLVLVSDWKMLKEYFSLSKEQNKYLHKIWPGPVSVILPHKGLFPSVLSLGLEALAVRLPKSDFLVKMIKVAGTPIVSTSLNLSAKPHLDDVDGLENYFSVHKPDLIIDSGRQKGQPSKLIDLRDMKNIKILRK